MNTKVFEAFDALWRSSQIQNKEFEKMMKSMNEFLTKLEHEEREHMKSITAPKTYTRLPKVWEYDEDDNEYIDFLPLKFFAQHCDQMQSGDVVQLMNGYRGNFIYLVDQEGKLINLHDHFTLNADLFSDAEVGFPAWPIEMGIEHGYPFKEILQIYMQNSRCEIYIAPLFKQNEKLKYDQEILAYRNYANRKIKIKMDSKCFENDINMKKIFLI